MSNHNTNYNLTKPGTEGGLPSNHSGTLRKAHCLGILLLSHHDKQYCRSEIFTDHVSGQVQKLSQCVFVCVQTTSELHDC